MTEGSVFLLILLILPLAGAIVVAAMGGAPVRTVKLTALVISLVEVVVAALLWISYRISLTAAQTLGGTSVEPSTMHETLSVSWIPSLGIHFSIGVDGISLVMIALIAVLMPIVFGASWEEKLPAGRTIGGYFSLLLVFQFSLVGVFAATDVFLFYMFFEIMLIPMYFLIGYFGGPRRAYAATKFILYSLVGSLLMLASVIGLYLASGHQLPAGTLDWEALRQIAHQIPESTQLWIFAGFAIAFAIKAPLVPLHTWLPDAGAEAPNGTSTLLVTLLDKVGTFGFLRICLPLLPAASAKLAWLFLLLGVLGILYAAIVAAGQSDLKRFVTYTSIAHFGFIAVGIFAFTRQSIAGATLYMVNHGLATGLLFIIIGMLISRGGSRMMADYGGVWKVAPILGGVFMVATMATVALPGTNSFVSEFLVLIGVFDRSITWGVLATIGMILAAVYMLWVFQKTMNGPIRGSAVLGPDPLLPGGRPTGKSGGSRRAELGAGGTVEPEGDVLTATKTAADGRRVRFGDLNLREIAVVTPLVVLIVFLGIYPKPVLDVINPTAAQTVSDVGAPGPASTDALNGGGK